MAELNEQQVELIAAYIKQKGVAQEALYEDLLDHVCTSIERQMDQGVSFDDAFEQTIKLFGPGGLKQVQQQTFELLTEMNETMKKVTFSFGLTSTILLLAGTIFKLMHWPGAGIMILLGAAILVLVYLPLMLRHKLKESPGNEALMHISGYIGLTLTTLGVLFKIMHWPGALVMLTGGISVLGFLYVPIYFFKRYKASANKPVTLSTGLVAMTCLVLVFALISVRNSSEFDRGMALVTMDLNEANQRLQHNQVLYDRLGSSAEVDALRTEVNESVSYLEDLKLHLIAATEGISLEQAEGLQVQDLKRKYNYDVPTYMMWSVPESDPYHITQLVTTLEDVESAVLEVYPGSMHEDIKAMMPFNIHQNYEYQGGKAGWGKYHYYKVPLASILAQLSKLQVDIKQLESQTLLYLTSQLNVPAPPSGDGATSG